MKPDRDKIMGCHFASSASMSCSFWETTLFHVVWDNSTVECQDVPSKSKVIQLTCVFWVIVMPMIQQQNDLKQKNFHVLERTKPSLFGTGDSSKTLQMDIGQNTYQLFSNYSDSLVDFTMLTKMGSHTFSINYLHCQNHLFWKRVCNLKIVRLLNKWLFSATNVIMIAKTKSKQFLELFPPEVIYPTFSWDSFLTDWLFSSQNGFHVFSLSYLFLSYTGWGRWINWARHIMVQVHGITHSILPNKLFRVSPTVTFFSVDLMVHFFPHIIYWYNSQPYCLLEDQRK